MKPAQYTDLAKRIEESTFVIGQLARLLLNNGGYKGEPGDIDISPQIDELGESAIQDAIRLLAGAARRDFCNMGQDLGIPQ